MTEPCAYFEITVSQLPDIFFLKDGLKKII